MKRILFFLLLCCFTTNFARGMQVKEGSVVDPLCDDMWFVIFEFIGEIYWHCRTGMLVCKEMRELSKKFLRLSTSQPLTIKLCKRVFRSKKQWEFKKRLNGFASFLTDDMEICLVCFAGNDITNEQLAVIVDVFKQNLVGLVIGWPQEDLRNKDVGLSANAKEDFLNGLDPLLTRGSSQDREVQRQKENVRRKARLMAVESLTIKGLRSLKQCCNSLASLTLVRCNKIDNGHLRELAKKLKNLSYLRIEYCPKVTEKVVRCIKEYNENLKVVHDSWSTVDG